MSAMLWCPPGSLTPTCTLTSLGESTGKVRGCSVSCPQGHKWHCSIQGGGPPTKSKLALHSQEGQGPSQVGCLKGAILWVQSALRPRLEDWSR